MQAHGHYQLWRQQNVVVAKATGQWNAEMAWQAYEQFKHISQPLLGRQWAHLVYLEQWQLGTPEIDSIIAQWVSWAIEQGLTRTAQVYGASSLKQAQLDNIDRQSHGPHIRRGFNTLQQAQDWLTQEGFSLDMSELMDQLHKDESHG